MRLRLLALDEDFLAGDDFRAGDFFAPPDFFFPPLFELRDEALLFFADDAFFAGAAFFAGLFFAALENFVPDDPPEDFVLADFAELPESLDERLLEEESLGPVIAGGAES